jgi:hypothetical protein
MIPDSLDSAAARCIDWLSRLALYHSDRWSTEKSAMKSAYFSLAAVGDLSGWHEEKVPNWTSPDFFTVPDPEMLNLVHFDVVRLSRLIEHFPPHTPALWRRIERVLYILGSLSHTTKYVQGFNEILAPIFCVLLRGKILFEDDDEIEAVAFHALHSLLTQTRLSDFFTTQDGSLILLYRLRQFERLVERHLPATSAIIRQFKIHPMCYCFRWLSLLFAQDHPLDEVVMLWDELFARIDWIVDYAMYVALGHLSQMEEKLDKGSSSCTMHVLQNGQACDLKLALETAETLWEADSTAQKTETTIWMPAVLSSAARLCWSYIVSLI